MRGGPARNEKDRLVVTLHPEGQSKGKVIFSYIIDGFLLDDGESIPNKHTNIWQSVSMAGAFVELGYTVEVISYRNQSFVPEGEYAAVVDVRWNLERIAPMLNKDCIKIVHLDTAHILFHNAAESRRLLELQERRGVTLRPRRFEMPNLAIEYADFATTGGNDVTIGTYKYANKKIYKLPSPCAVTFDWIDKRDWKDCRQRFLWFSSSGLVHKGLDLVLEAFVRMPDYQLIICAPLNKDADFLHEYHEELYETPNIETIGWVDVEGERFREITAACVAVLHASCSEGGAPSVKTCMHAGLIPVVSYETGVDVEDFGFTLKSCSVDEIEETIRNIATLSAAELQERSRKSWEFARQHHTRENFAKEYRKVIAGILSV